MSSADTFDWMLQSPRTQLDPSTVDQLERAGQLDPVTAAQMRERESVRGSIANVQAKHAAMPAGAGPALPKSDKFSDLLEHLTKAPKTPEMETFEAPTDEAEPVATGGAMTTRPGPMSQIEAGGAMEEAGLLADAQAQERSANEQESALQSSTERSDRINATVQTLEAEKVKARYYADQKLSAYQEDASLMRQYPGLDLDQVKEHQRRIDELQQQLDKGVWTGGAARDMRKELQRRQLELRSAEDIDPSGGLSGGHRVMAAIAMALGAYGSALARTPNYAMQIVQEQVNRNIAAQKERFAKVRNQADLLEDRASREHGLAMKHFDDGIARYHAMEAAEWQRAQRLMQMVAVRTKGAEAKARAAQMIGQTEIKIGEAREKVNQFYEQLAIEKAAKAGRQPALPVDVEPIGPIDEKSAEKVQPVVAGYQQAKSVITRLRELRRSKGWTVFDRATVEEAKRLAKEYINARKNLEGYGGALSPTEKELIDLGVDDPTKLGFVMDKLDAADKALETSVGARLRSLNVRMRGEKKRGSELKTFQAD